MNKGVWAYWGRLLVLSYRGIRAQRLRAPRCLASLSAERIAEAVEGADEARLSTVLAKDRPEVGHEPGQRTSRICVLERAFGRRSISRPSSS